MGNWLSDHARDPETVLCMKGIPSKLPRGWEVSEEWDSSNMREGEQKNSETCKVMIPVVRCPSTFKPNKLIAKQSMVEVEAYAKMKMAFKKHGMDMSTVPELAQPVCLSKHIVVLPWYHMSLSDAMERKDPSVPNINTIMRLGQDMVRAVVALGRCGIVHTDIAPPNICLWRRHGEVHAVMIDFETNIDIRRMGNQHWKSIQSPRPRFSSLRRHARYRGTWTTAPYIDVADALEECGWVLTWCICCMIGQPFVTAHHMVYDTAYYKECAKRAEHLGQRAAIHAKEAETEKEKRVAHEKMLRGECPFKGWPASVASTMCRYFTIVENIPRRDDKRTTTFNMTSTDVNAILKVLQYRVVEGEAEEIKMKHST